VEDKKWYIVNTQTSCENVAKTAIEERINTKNMQEFFGEILVPAENVVQLIKGKKQNPPSKLCYEFFPYSLLSSSIYN
jgi:transcriptional antiterminator NusG